MIYMFNIILSNFTEWQHGDVFPPINNFLVDFFDISYHHVNDVVITPCEPHFVSA